jgi:hydrogenase maturation protease
VTIVVGVGNRLRGDDAAGLAVIDRLRTAGLPDGVRIVEREGEAVALIDEWEAAEEVIVVDAVRSGAPAGTVHRVDALAAPLPAAFARTSSHAFGIAETIELARALGRLPGRLEVYGIEGTEFGAGRELGPVVRRAGERLAAELTSRLGAADP